jgi:phosphoglycolate phosphatase
VTGSGPTGSGSTGSGPPGAVLARPRGLLFDWDGTLIDNWASIEAAINATLTAWGHKPWTQDEVRVKVRASLRDSFPAIFGARWEEARRLFYDTIRAHHLETVKALPGAAELIDGLAEDGFHLGVVSNKAGELLRREAAHLGWSGYFKHLVGAGDAPRDKPDPAPVSMALAGSGITPGREVWLVGDTALDMVCAHAAGCVPVLVEGQGHGIDDFSLSPPALEVQNCFELLALVRRL